MEELILQGKRIPYERGIIPVANCRLDPKNPRIAYLVGQRANGLTDDELDDLIWAKDSVKALGQSIQQNGGVYDAVIVQRDGDRFIVREGNSRTVASRHLLEQYPDDGRFVTMPAMIFDDFLSEEDLAVLLADMHVAGKIRWDAYEQAKHVSDLYNVYGKTYDWLGNHLRLSKGKIVELLTAYRATEEYLASHPDPANVRKFAVFHELMKKRELRDKFQNDLQFRQQFHKWLTENRITDSKQVRDLPLILAIPEATKALNEAGVDEANRTLMRENPALESDLFAAVKMATDMLNKAPMNDVQDLRQGNAKKVIMLRNLHRAIQDLATIAEVSL